MANFSRMSDLAWAALSSWNSFFVVATFAAPDMVTFQNKHTNKGRLGQGREGRTL